MQTVSRQVGLLIEAECARLVLDAAFYRDRSMAEEWADLFAMDAEMVTAQGMYRGRDAIREYVWKTPVRGATIHSVTNVRIDALSAEEARGNAAVCVFMANDTIEASLSPFVVGSYLDQYRTCEGSWKISRREFVVFAARMPT